MMSNVVSGVIGGKKDQLGFLQNGFFQLILTEMKFQDPTANVENLDFVQQLATISIASQISEVNDQIKNLANGQQLVGNSQDLQFIHYLDRNVMVDTNGTASLEGGRSNLTFALNEMASVVKVTIKDGSGKNVYNREIRGAFDPGAHNIDWTGVDDSGQHLPDGMYFVSFEAVDSKGNPVNAATKFSAKVRSVVMSEGSRQPYLIVDDAIIALGQVKSVSTDRPMNGYPEEAGNLFGFNYQDGEERNVSLVG